MKPNHSQDLAQLNHTLASACWVVGAVLAALLLMKCAQALDSGTDPSTWQDATQIDGE